MPEVKILELIDQLYLDFRTVALATDPLLQKINKLGNTSVQLELSVRIKRIQVEALVTLELLSDLQNFSDESEFNKVLGNYSEVG